MRIIPSWVSQWPHRCFSERIAEPIRERNIRVRIGPFSVRNGGTVFPGAITGANTTCGLLVCGLDPPTAGNAWHPAHEFKLKRGPSPSATPSTCVNCGTPLFVKKAPCPAERPPAPVGNGCPAPGGPPRIPGSTCACIAAIAISEVTRPILKTRQKNSWADSGSGSLPSE